MIEAEEYARNIFLKSPTLYPKGSTYEGIIRHIEDLIKAALLESKGKYGFEIRNAAWLHDIGRTITFEGYVKESIRLTKYFFEKQNLSSAQEEIILDCILNYSKDKLPTTDAGRIFQKAHKIISQEDETKDSQFNAEKKKDAFNDFKDRLFGRFAISARPHEESAYSKFDKEKIKKLIKISGIIFVIFAIIIFIWLIYPFDTPMKNSSENARVANEKTSEAYKAPNNSLASKGSCTEYVEIKGKISAEVTLDNACSKIKPELCKQGKLINNCTLCGCEASEICGKNGECETIPSESIGGGGGLGALSPGKEVEGSPGGAGGGAGEKAVDNTEQGKGCADSDASYQPDAAFISGSCTDAAGTYHDKCQDPLTKADSTTWIEEYKCQPSSNGSACVGVFKSCPVDSETYFGSDSECQLNKCVVKQIIPSENCSDGIKNQDETDIDCGGLCGGYFYDDSCHETQQVLDEETCNDGIMNQDETDIDCGGICGGYFYDDSCHETQQVLDEETCNDGIMNQDETDIDCGGVCDSCQQESGSGEETPPSCTVSSIDQTGLSIFTNSVCHDSSGDYENSCSSPIMDQESDVFIETYICVDDTCTSKYYSCPVKGKEIFGIDNYKCSNGECTT